MFLEIFFIIMPCVHFYSFFCNILKHSIKKMMRPKFPKNFLKKVQNDKKLHIFEGARISWHSGLCKWVRYLLKIFRNVNCLFTKVYFLFINWKYDGVVRVYSSHHRMLNAQVQFHKKFHIAEERKNQDWKQRKTSVS